MRRIDIEKKVSNILQVKTTEANSETPERIIKVLSKNLGKEKAEQIAFHLTDWSKDAAFICALNLFPDKFTNRQIKDGIYRLLAHAPEHLAAAAKLFGVPVRDTFGVGALNGEE